MYLNVVIFMAMYISMKYSYIATTYFPVGWQVASYWMCERQRVAKRVYSDQIWRDGRELLWGNFGHLKTCVGYSLSQRISPLLPL
jgi:hypothetical protein